MGGRQPQHRIWNVEPRLLPELELAGHARFPAAAPRQLAEHRHAGAYEICLLERGCVWWWAGGEVYEVPAGHLYITRPDEPHGGVDAVMQACVLSWIQIAFAPRRGVAALADPALAAAFARTSRRVFPATPMVREGFRRLIDEHRGAAAAHAATAARSALHQVLAGVLRAHDAAEAGQPSPAIARAQAWARAHLDQPLRVAGMARAAGLRPSRFHERFQAEVGSAPAEWLVLQRVDLAKRLLREAARPIISVALAAGFSSSQYFAHAFRRITGMQPGAYRARILSR